MQEQLFPEDDPAEDASFVPPEELSRAAKEMFECLQIPINMVALLLGISRVHASNVLNCTRPGYPTVRMMLELIRCLVDLRIRNQKGVPARVVELLAQLDQASRQPKIPAPLAERPRQRTPSKGGRRERV